MVVSKDSKRKRKESSPPATAQQQSSTAVESSPEMPKRTKVQAQRKFAQGQSAPQSSYSSIIAASSSSNTGPSTSSECREPPTEILPNKRPKTEDFLTFLCFRGSSALPPHLDFLNQGKSKEPERPVKKPTVKPVIKKKGKKGRPPKNAKHKEENMSRSKEEGEVNKNDVETSQENQTDINITEGNNKHFEKVQVVVRKDEEGEGKCDVEGEEEEDDDVPSFAVRKRAEVVADGNRRANRNNADEKCNNSMETSKRRSNRASTKGSKFMLDHLSDEEDDEYFSAVDENSKALNSDIDNKERKNTKTPANSERKSETPSKESETTGKSRKGRPASNNKKKDVENSKEIERDESVKSDIKEKAPVKRQRQKESPIFIPSPEPSGRMTRQRAFFEPVKVPHKDNDDEAKNDVKKEDGGEKQVEINSNAIETTDQTPTVKNEECNEKISAALICNDKSKPTQLDVFDFSSDDEQPLAKAIKLKKSGTNKSSPKKSNPRGKKSSPKKESTEESIKNPDKEDIKTEQADGVKKESTTMENVTPATENDSLKTKEKRSSGQSTKYSKKKEHDESLNDTDKESIVHSPKKQSNARQSRKKNKADNNKNVAGEIETEDNQGSPTRNQRPSRKTKEAATIYMGIIGHRLQMAEDDDDDISLSSFDRPNVREMEKMENELKRNSASAGKGSPPPKQAKSSDMPEPPSIPISTAATGETKPTTGRRGRPPKNSKIQAAVQLPKREIEGMLVKKGAIAKLTQSTENLAETKDSKTEPSKAGTEDDEDFLLNEELNETKRKLEKSFSDSDDEPLAIKAHVKSSDKDGEESRKSAGVGGGEKGGECISPLALPTTVANPPTTSIGGLTSLSMLPITTKSIATTTTTSNQTHLISTSQTTPVTTCIPTTVLATPPAISAPIATTPSPISCNIQPPAPVTPTSQSPFKSIEKKSPVPTSKILNVPATYGIPPASPTGNIAGGINTNFGKSPMYVPQSPAHYHSPHSSHIRPTTSMQQFPVQSVKNPSLVAPPSNTVTSHLTTPQSQMTAQSPIKYQTPPTTYPPPIEAYPSPKINPNFLTPKFDRNTLSRPGNNTGNNNSFPSPSPVKFDMSGSSSGLLKNSSLSAPNATMSPKTLLSSNINFMGNNPTTSTSAAGQVVNDPLKDEIGSILAANLMPSKEESGKIFGIASVSLAQSSGPDNTKCTLGKCGSIHKPVLGPVVPTESYIGDQLSGKERRKAKVNMTHEQIHKWLIECSSNPDEIQDDLDDDFDSDLRPNNFGSTPPPTRDDKESTSFSSSSKATRDLGKSESAWSAKGPSLKATPVVATTSAINNRKEDVKPIEPTSPRMDEEIEKNSPVMNMMFDKIPVNKQSPAPGSLDEKITQSDKSEKKSDKKGKDENISSKTVPNETKHSKSVEMEVPTTINKSSSIGKQNSNQKSLNQKKTTPSPVTTPTTANTNNKQNRKKTAPEVVEEKSVNANQKESVNSPDVGISNSASNSINRTPKRTPVYQQKQTSKLQQHQQSQQQDNTDLKISTTTSHKRTSTAYGTAFSVENEKSIYSFDKDDAEDQEKSNKPSTYRRQSRKDSGVDNNGVNTTPTNTVQRTPPTKPKRNAAAVAEIANKELAGGNSQTSSVSLTLSPSEKTKLVKVSLDGDTKTTKSTKGGKGGKKNNQNEAKIPANEAESDSGDGHTFYIPLQGIGAGGDGDGGIQGVAVKLGREGPDGPNQKVIMHATLVTKAQMGSNTKPLPDTMNVSDIVKNLMTSDKKGSGASTSAAAAAATNSCSNSMKNVPIGTVQPRFKGDSTAQGPSTSSAGGGGGSGGLQRVNSNSSLFSGSVKSRNAAVAAGASGSGATAHGSNKKFKDDTPIKMANNTAFPRHDDPTQMVEAPIFRPSEKEFADPIEFIERITPIAARFGICKIIPPASFKPECRISDEMRFTAYNQYVHKLLHRWGPSAKELSAIKKYLTTQSIVMNHPPWIGGMEVDLPRLYHTVQELGGLKEVIEKKKWARVAEEMCIPKLAQDRVTKLDDIYCKYLLPYDTLSPAERQKLFDEVEADWAKREARARRNADRFVNTESVSNEEDDVTSENDEEESEEEVDGVSMECIVKGRSMPLSQFYRIARNTMALWFKNTEPTVNEVEAEFWRHVAVRDSHVCVHSGSIDSSGWGFGFPSPGPKGKGSNYARHPWNLKVLTNNTGSVLRSLGPVMGVTVPTLHVGMLFSACCWYRDPHGLSWIEYLHTGASKLWYGIPDDQSANFRAALTSLIPTHCQNKTIWLPCDTVMVPPHMLTDRGVSLCRIEQKPGEFIVVFPRAYTSSLATGYVVSESVYFATSSWLDLAKDDFRDIHDSCEPAMFSLEQLLFALGYDQRVTPDTLQQMLPMLQEVYEKETAAREQLKAAGVTSTEKVGNEKSGKSKKQQQPPHKSIESECDLCRANLYISMVRTDEGNVYCLQHALKNLNNGNIQAKQCKLIYAYNIDDIENLIKNLKDRIQQKRAVTNKKQK
ncbi:jumonji, AT rich interactive domain 2 [Cochliomyia hominivorax]